MTMMVQANNQRASVTPEADESNQATLRIKNMVCDRCIMSVESLLRNKGFGVSNVTLGEAVVTPQPEPEQLENLRQSLEEIGFELARDRRDEMVTTIKSELIAYLNLVEKKQLAAEQSPPLISEYLSGKLHRSYPTLSRAFTASEDISIERYLIRLRIERVKELLSYGDLTLSEVAWQLGYSSVQHLSAQFKTVTGMSVSEYKKNRDQPRQNLDTIR